MSTRSFSWPGIFIVALGLFSAAVINSAAQGPDSAKQDGAAVSDRELLFLCRVTSVRRDLLAPHEQQTIMELWRTREVAWRELHQTQNTELDQKLIASVREACRQALGLSTNVADLKGKQTRSPKLEHATPITQSETTGPQTAGNSAQRAHKQIEPWPPPVPTVSAYFRDIGKAARGRFTNIGILSDALETLLKNSGYSEIRYWNAPHGFAIVTRVESIDSEARPVKLDRAVQHLDPREPESIFDYIFQILRQLISAPNSQSRLFLFIATDDDKIDHPIISMTPEIGESWITQGARLGLTDQQRMEKITSKHKLIVFVYEFSVDQQGEPALLLRDERHSVDDHLRASRINLSEDILK